MAGMITLVAIGLLLLFWAVGAYKRLVSMRIQLKNAFARFDVQLKQRYELVPNLVETAKGYMKQEREALEAVIAARNQAVIANAKAVGSPAGPGAIQQMAAAESALSSSLARMFVLSQAYPDLKGDHNMSQLNEELATTENRIALARQAYNDGVMEYNASIEQFPVSIIAFVFAFKSTEPFESNELPHERSAVRAPV
jgi:LemA protein